MAKKRSQAWKIVAAAVIILGIWGYSMSAPADFPKNGAIFSVAQGTALENLATELNSEHYIRSRFIFVTVVTFLGGEHRISPGDYYFPEGRTVLGIALQIARGDHNLLPIKITVPEGDNVQEIGALLAEKLPDFSSSDFITQATPDEGYLFPETYFIYPKTKSPEIISDMRSMFTRQTASLVPLSSDTVILASIIEREASGNADRAIIADILSNRLKNGMRLQVDAAPETYTQKGLPKAPISNPGLAALQAAANPKPTPYLYYLHDTHGTIHYAKTYAEHLVNIKKYLK